MAESSKFEWGELGYIVYRNVFLLVNALIAVVSLLLIFFGAAQSGIFLGAILIVNIALGLFQDIRAWLALRKLQLLTAPHVTRRLDDGTEEVISIQSIKKGDILVVHIGEQIPCDGLVRSAQTFEINQGLITGESDSIPKNDGDEVSAGSIVTSGNAMIEVKAVFKESRIARMTEGVKRYSVSVSPIQRSINRIIQTTGYILLVSLAFVVVRGFMVDASIIEIVKNAGALTSSMVPQGLMFAATLLFAYGAAHLFRKNVLLQEVNATEKLGRIQNLCMDKTGTLTDNTLVVEEMLFRHEEKEQGARKLVAAYLEKSGDASQRINAIHTFLAEKNGLPVHESIAFSSWRHFGAIATEYDQKKIVVAGGSPNTFIHFLADESEKQWLSDVVKKYALLGKHVLCFFVTEQASIPKEVNESSWSFIATFIFKNNLREGIEHTVDFFENRGVKIRIISGDNARTTQTIAARAGVKNAEHIVTGKELATWKDADFSKNIEQFAVFAEINPEQKEKIVEAFKRNGFTAMIGDGANDALAIKKADLGIAMFDGAPATRQLAPVVLMNNSFSALPGGVELADAIIRNLEVFTSIFITPAFACILFFVAISIANYSFPLAPLNITLLNYFTVGLPGLLISYWAIRPVEKLKPVHPDSFFKKVMPFIYWSALLHVTTYITIFFLSPEHIRRSESNTPLLLALIFLGIVFFICSARLHLGKISTSQIIQFIALIALEAILLPFAFTVPIFMKFFETIALALPLPLLVTMLVVLLCAALVQFFIMRSFLKRSTL